jgi:transcriptional regulator with XRE-family HTH domain
MQLRVKELRKQKGLTQVQVAARAGLSQSYFNEIETGKKTVNARRLEAIAKALGVPVTELIGGDESDPRVRLLRAFDLMTPDQRSVAVSMAEALAGITKSAK